MACRSAAKFSSRSGAAPRSRSSLSKRPPTAAPAKASQALGSRCSSRSRSRGRAEPNSSSRCRCPAPGPPTTQTFPHAVGGAASSVDSSENDSSAKADISSVRSSGSAFPDRLGGLFVTFLFRGGRYLNRFQHQNLQGPFDPVPAGHRHHAGRQHHKSRQRQEHPDGRTSAPGIHIVVTVHVLPRYRAAPRMAAAQIQQRDQVLYRSNPPGHQHKHRRAASSRVMHAVSCARSFGWQAIC